MKKLGVFLFLLLSLLSCTHKQTTNVIYGKIEGAAPGGLVLLVRTDPQTSERILLDQTRITGESEFLLETEATGTAATLYYVTGGEDTALENLKPGRNSLMIFLEGYDFLTLKGEAGNLFLAEVQGGLYALPDIRQMNHIHREGFRLQQQIQYLSGEVQQTGDPDMRREMQEIITQARALYEPLPSLQREFVAAHPELASSAWLLRQEGGVQQNMEEYEKLFLALHPEVRESLAGQEVQLFIDRVRGTGVGGKAPEFELASLEGNQVKLSDMKGKYVLLDFWGSWCGPCRAAAPKLIEFYEEVKDKENIVIVGIGCWEQNADNWRQAIEEDGLPWLQLLDATRLVTEKYVITSVPHTILISPEGIILKRDHPLALLPEVKQVINM